MNEKDNVSSSTHIRDKVTSSNIMLYVVIALLPATFFGIWNFRHENAWILVVVTTAAAVLSEYLYEKLMHNFDVTGVQGRFDAVVCGDMISRSKPAPDIYLRAAELLGVAPQECMALEDSPNGIRSGIAAGMYTVMIPDMIPATEELLAIASNKVDTLLDIMPLLDQLGSPEICQK